MNQKTLAKPIECTGVGIHSGEEVRLIINPAPAGHGIVFVRTDKDPVVRIPAIWENIKSGINASTLGANGVRIGTVEHLMAALSGAGIDNAEVLVDGPEVPILDGSAGPFVKMIKEAGVAELEAARPWIVVKEPVKVRVNGSFAEVRPASEPSIHCTISFNHPMLSHQEMRALVSPDTFEGEIAGARTFGFLSDVEKLKALGLGLGGSLDNAVVFNDQGVMNTEGLRWEDECVRHKILDIIGDISLAGLPILGEVVTHKTGHSLNHMLVRELITSPEAYEITDSIDLA